MSIGSSILRDLSHMSTPALQALAARHRAEGHPTAAHDAEAVLMHRRAIESMLADSPAVALPCVECGDLTSGVICGPCSGLELVA